MACVSVCVAGQWAVGLVDVSEVGWVGGKKVVLVPDTRTA